VSIAFAVGSIVLMGGIAIAYQDVNRRRGNADMLTPLTRSDEP
jgi:hypothetical protein